VLLLRDELANMAWGIERTVVGASGQPVDRTLMWRTAAPPATPPSGADVQQYRLGSTVPDYWLPFLPVVANPGAPVQLRRGKLPTSNAGPMGRMLAYPNMTLFSEEVPREGVHLEHRYRVARGPDGSTYLWIGRRRPPVPEKVAADCDSTIWSRAARIDTDSTRPCGQHTPWATQRFLPDGMWRSAAEFDPVSSQHA